MGRFEELKKVSLYHEIMMQELQKKSDLEIAELYQESLKKEELQKEEIKQLAYRSLDGIKAKSKLRGGTI